MYNNIRKGRKSLEFSINHCLYHQLLRDASLPFNSSKKETYPVTTDLRNLVALSTTSSQTEDTVPSSKRDASGRARSASSDSCNNSLHKSASSPKEHSKSSHIPTFTEVREIVVHSIFVELFFNTRYKLQTKFSIFTWTFNCKILKKSSPQKNKIQKGENPKQLISLCSHWECRRTRAGWNKLTPTIWPNSPDWDRQV